jgi:hypothetical protein
VTAKNRSARKTRPENLLTKPPVARVTHQAP